MATITKKDLVERIAEATGQKRGSVKETVEAFLELLTAELAEGNRVEFRDFGVLEVRLRAERRAQNPKTLEPVRVPPRPTVKFKVGRLMQQRLDAGRAAQPKPQVEVRARKGAAAGV
ncbi:MAG: HU family DNA-binding protein [Phycisphaerales bacterium]